MNATEFTKYWYKKQVWAFLSDYLRLHVLHTQGGIYLDADKDALPYAYSSSVVTLMNSRSDFLKSETRTAYWTNPWRGSQEADLCLLILWEKWRICLYALLKYMQRLSHKRQRCISRFRASFHSSCTYTQQKVYE